MKSGPSQPVASRKPSMNDGEPFPITNSSAPAAWRSIGPLRRGMRQGRTQGDPWQQGGVLVIARGGAILWSQASDGPGDNASADQILKALAKAA